MNMFFKTDTGFYSIINIRIKKVFGDYQIQVLIQGDDGIFMSPFNWVTGDRIYTDFNKVNSVMNELFDKSRDHRVILQTAAF